MVFLREPPPRDAGKMGTVELLITYSVGTPLYTDGNRRSRLRAFHDISPSTLRILEGRSPSEERDGLKKSCTAPPNRW